MSFGLWFWFWEEEGKKFGGEKMKSVKEMREGKRGDVMEGCLGCSGHR